MFTVFMLFLPSGLGVYMFTNSVLAISQQWVVEYYSKRTLARTTEAGAGGIEVRDKTGTGDGSGRGGKKGKKGERGASDRSGRGARDDERPRA